MADQYELYLQSPAGIGLGTLSQVVRCQYARGQNVAGEMTLTVPAGHYPSSLFQPYGRILVQRQIGRGLPYIDFNTPWFILNGPTYSLDASGLELMTFECMDALGLILSSRNIVYNEYNEFTDKLGAADDLMKAIIRENYGSLALETARDISSALAVQEDVAAAPVLHIDGLAHKQVLDALTEISNASANDDTPVWLGFDIEFSDQIAGLLEFRTYPNQRGVDHRFPGGNPPVLLSAEAGNLSNITVSTEHKEAASVVYAGGPGVGDIRAVISVEDAAILALSPFARREKWVDASSVTDPDALENLANAELRNARPRVFMEAELVETGTTLRGIHWDFGDFLTAYYRDLTFEVRVDKVAVSLEPGEGGGLVASTKVMLRGEVTGKWATGYVPIIIEPPEEPPDSIVYEDAATDFDSGLDYEGL